MSQQHEPPTAGNTYARFLRARGLLTINVAGVDWLVYQRFLLPAYLPHCVPPINEDQARVALAATRCPFARWDSDLGTPHATGWWYVLKRGNWSLDQVTDRKKRWMVRQGVKGFTVRQMSYEEVVEHCSRVAVAAASRYRNPTGVESQTDFSRAIEAGKSVPGVLEFTGCFSGEQLASYSENLVSDGAVWLHSIRHDPAFLSKYSSYGLVNGLLEHYLNERGMKYVLDGCRNLHHDTNFQEQLVRVFGFALENAVLNVAYAGWFRPLVAATRPFGRWMAVLSSKCTGGPLSSLFGNVAAVLKQDAILRTGSIPGPREA